MIDKSPTYKVTSDIINFMEDSVCLWSPKVSILKDIPKDIPILSNLIKILYKKIHWIWRKGVVHLFLLIYGFISLMKNAFVSFLFFGLLIIAISIVIPNNNDIFQIVDLNMLIDKGILFVLIIASFFSSDYSYDEADFNRIKGCVKRLNNLNFEQVNAIKKNFQLFRNRYNKRVLFLNSFITFFWVIFFTFLLYFLKYKDFKISSIYIELICKYVFIFLIAFVLIRAYIKVYQYIFDIIEVSCNEVLSNVEISKSKKVLYKYYPSINRVRR